MKVLLANPPYIVAAPNDCERYYIRSGSRWPYSMLRRKGEKSILRYHVFPFFLAYAAALLKKAGHQVSVVDGVTLDLSHDEFLARVKSKAPDVYVFEPMNVALDHDLQTVRRLRESLPQLCTIAVGPLIAGLADQVLAPDSPIPYVIQGEYELALRDLVASLAAGRRDHTLAGLAFREGDRIIKNGFTPLIDPLDLLAPPARELFPDDEQPSTEWYMDQLSQYHPVVQMHASRRCPYHCYFCLWNQVFYRRGKYRMHSPLRVVDEMEQAVRDWGAHEIYFDDDDFTISKKQVQAICDELIRRRLNVKWSCQGDAINLDEETLRKMAQAGCIGLKFGVESADERVMSRIKKPVQLEKVRALCDFCARNGIRTHGTFSFGLLNETRESMAKTLAFACSLDMDSAQFSIATPYPGTEFFEQAASHLDVHNPELWTQLDGGSQSLIDYEGLPKEEISRFYATAMTTWLRHRIRSPRWAWRQLVFLYRKWRIEGIRPFLSIFAYALRKLFGR